MNNNHPLYAAVLPTPIGMLEVTGDDTAIVSVKFIEENNIHNTFHQNPIVTSCIEQLREYFSGERKVFEINMNQGGTDFQKTVWKELLNIPFGKTRSYLELSKMLHHPKAIRAVGTANGKNNIAIIVPCHRIIGNNGTLVGYAGGLWRKRWLLEHEQKLNNGKLSLF